MSDALKVALVSPEFPPATIGGIGAVANDLAINLSRKGVQTTVFCGRSNKISVEHPSTNLRIVRMPLLSYPPRHLWFQIQNFAPLLSMFKEFDVIHNLDPRGGLLAPYSKGLKAPFISHVHGCGHCETAVFLKSPVSSWAIGDFAYTVLEYPLTEFLTNVCLRNSDYLVVCSAVRLEEMKRRNPELDYSKVSVIYNGIDFNRIDPENVGSREKDGSVLYWGRLYYNKGIIQLVNAMKIVKNSYPDVRLDMCGKGPLENKLRSLVKKLGLEKNVYVHGYTKYADLVEKIKSASVIALPSLYEGQPVAALEAMAHRKPVVMYDFPFAREYISDWKDGLIAKGWDVPDLAHRIEAALSDKKLRLKLSENAYARVKRNHNWDTLVNDYINLYGNLRNKKK